MINFYVSSIFHLKDEELTIADNYCDVDSLDEKLGREDC